MTMTTSRLTQIARENHETGVHGQRYLAMTTATFDALIKRWPGDSGQRLADQSGLPYVGTVFGGSLVDLNAILVVADDSLPVGTWRLVDTATGDMIEQGTVPDAD